MEGSSIRDALECWLQSAIREGETSSTIVDMLKTILEDASDDNELLELLEQ